MNTEDLLKSLFSAVLAGGGLLFGGCSGIKAKFYIGHMEREERLETLQVERVVETLQISPGMRVADIGAGSGLFTRPMAKKARSGVVYAVDINTELLEHIEKTAKREHIANIKTVAAAEGDSNIPEPVDLIFICDTLHYIDKPDLYLKKLYQHMRPKGRTAVINFYRNWPPGSNKFSAETLDAWMDEAGFDSIERHDFPRDRYFAIFQRRPAEAKPAAGFEAE